MSERESNSPQVKVEQGKVHIAFIREGVMVDVLVTADKNVQATHTNLTPQDLAAIEAENQFSGVIRQDIGSYLQWQASKLTPGSEVVAAEIEHLGNRELFKQGVTTLRHLQYHPDQVKELVLGEGRLLEVGLAYMGQKIPHIVSEEVSVLNRYVDVFYINEERREQNEARKSAQPPARRRKVAKQPQPGQRRLL